MLQTGMELRWLYPAEGAKCYETSTFILGSVSPEVDVLTLNGESVTLYSHDHEQAFALKVPLQEGENKLALVTNGGISETRLLHRVPLWQLTDEQHLIDTVTPNAGSSTALMVGFSLPIEVRCACEVAHVWVHLRDAQGVDRASFPLRNDAPFRLAKQSDSHGARTSVAGLLRFSAQHPALATDVQVFNGLVTLEKALFATLSDSEKLTIYYSLQDTEGTVTLHEFGQTLTLWQYPRSMLVKGGHAESLYAGMTTNTWRVPLMPPKGTVYTVIGQPRLNDYWIQQSAHAHQL
jgi:hypothetical protein